MRTSFTPSGAQRNLTRCRRTFIRERVTLINRVQKLLEDANMKLASVASDIMGVSGEAILAVLLMGHTESQDLAELAKWRQRTKRERLAQASEGRARPPRRPPYEAAKRAFRARALLCGADRTGTAASVGL